MTGSRFDPLAASGDPDLDLTPLSVGFDLRKHDMRVSLPATARHVRFDAGGETRELIGTTVELVKALEAAGYIVEVQEANLLPLRIRGLIVELRQAQADELAAWGDLFVLAGRAVQLAESGDEPGALLALELLCNHEYELLGDCDRTGKLLAELGVAAPEPDPMGRALDAADDETEVPES